MKKKGSVYIDILISISIFLLVIIISTNFMATSSINKLKIKKQERYFLEINNKIANIYNLNVWDEFEDECIETEYGDIEIEYLSYKKNTPFLTSLLKIKFVFEDAEKEYVLEKVF